MSLRNALARTCTTEKIPIVLLESPKISKIILPKVLIVDLQEPRNQISRHSPPY